MSANETMRVLLQEMLGSPKSALLQHRFSTKESNSMVQKCYRKIRRGRTSKK